MSVRVWTSTAVRVRGAISCVEVSADDAAALHAVCLHAGVSLPEVGRSGLRSLCGVDEGVVVRWNPTRVTLMAHGAPVVTAGIEAAFKNAGAVVDSTATIRERFPEARSLVEACALEVMSRCASGSCVDILLEQVALWETEAPLLSERDAVYLGRLLEAPTVVAVGRANVGKSTLLNALAAQSVSVVSPEAGTTRDRVGVLLDVDGLTVRWLDTPGVREGASAEEGLARRLAEEEIGGAALVVHCGDAHHGWLDEAWLGSVDVVRCSTRGDLGAVEGAEVATAAESGAGVGALSRCVRERLVPGAVLGAAGRERWVFHPLLASVAPRG